MHVANGHTHAGSAASGVEAEGRVFTRDDASAVDRLSRRPTALGKRVKEAMTVLDKALDDYGMDRLALSFNGGKDCTVLVHLLAAAVVLRHGKLLPLQTVYVRCQSPFPQVEAFVTVCQKRYNLELVTVEGNMKHALEVYIDRKGKSKVDESSRTSSNVIQAVLVGTRRNDPHGATLELFQRTDSGWPDLMRIHPILDWSYAEIWDFLRSPDLTLGATETSSSSPPPAAADNRIEWCEMYDYGYTSLGSTHNTFPNPLLKATDDPTVLGGWRPAWELQDESQERAGREMRLKDSVDPSKALPSPPKTASLSLQ